MQKLTAVQNEDFSRPKGIQRSRRLPDPTLGALWDSIILEERLKAQLLSQAMLNFTIRGKVDRSVIPLHGVILLIGPPGTGKTSLARGLAHRTAECLRVSAGEGVRTAVLAGLGLAVASEWLFGPELESGEVVAVLQDWLLPSADLWAVFPAGRQASVKARAFASFVQLRVPNWGANGWPGNASLCSSRLPIVSAWIDNKSAGSVKHDVLSAAA